MPVKIGITERGDAGDSAVKPIASMLKKLSIDFELFSKVTSLSVVSAPSSEVPLSNSADGSAEDEATGEDVDTQSPFSGGED